jgi:hypothetical protein
MSKSLDAMTLKDFLKIAKEEGIADGPDLRAIWNARPRPGKHTSITEDSIRSVMRKMKMVASIDERGVVVAARNLHNLN